jgi:hypothetical protein
MVVEGVLCWEGGWAVEADVPPPELMPVPGEDACDPDALACAELGCADALWPGRLRLTYTPKTPTAAAAAAPISRVRRRWRRSASSRSALIRRAVPVLNRLIGTEGYWP